MNTKDIAEQALKDLLAPPPSPYGSNIPSQAFNTVLFPRITIGNGDEYTLGGLRFTIHVTIKNIPCGYHYKATYTLPMFNIHAEAGDNFLIIPNFGEGEETDPLKRALDTFVHVTRKNNLPDCLMTADIQSVIEAAVGSRTIQVCYTVRDVHQDAIHYTFHVSL